MPIADRGKFWKAERTAGVSVDFEIAIISFSTPFTPLQFPSVPFASLRFIRLPELRLQYLIFDILRKTWFSFNLYSSWVPTMNIPQVCCSSPQPRLGQWHLSPVVAAWAYWATSVLSALSSATDWAN
jgi:hypothetical protein